MACKKIVPKKLGSVKIPKNLRRIGDKALADPKVVGVVSGALASVGAIVAAREGAKVVPGGRKLVHAMEHSSVVNGVADAVKQAFEQVLHLRTSQPDPSSPSGKTKRQRDKLEAGAGEIGTDSEADTDRVH